MSACSFIKIGKVTIFVNSSSDAFKQKTIGGSSTNDLRFLSFDENWYVKKPQQLPFFDLPSVCAFYIVIVESGLLIENTKSYINLKWIFTRVYKYRHPLGYKDELNSIYKVNVIQTLLIKTTQHLYFISSYQTTHT